MQIESVLMMIVVMLLVCFALVFAYILGKKKGSQNAHDLIAKQISRDGFCAVNDKIYMAQHLDHNTDVMPR